MFKLPKFNYALATLALLAILFSTSCDIKKSKLASYGTVFETVMRSDTGVFRGFSLGDKFDRVQKMESAKPAEADSEYLYYELKIDSLGSFNITYSFDDTGLSEIQTDIFINNANDADDVFAKFKAFFDEHYGESVSNQGLTAWSVKSQKYGDVKINLSDVSTDLTVDHAPGKISLYIYPDKD